MIWRDLLNDLDEIRGLIRAEPALLKTPRAAVAKDHAVVVALNHLVESLYDDAAPKAVTIELDRHGKPVIPDDMRDLFATVPVEFVPPRNPNVGTGVTRRNPVVSGQGIQPAAAAPKATVLPRDTPRIDHPVDLEDATEATVAK